MSKGRASELREIRRTGQQAKEIAQRTNHAVDFAARNERVQELQQQGAGCANCKCFKKVVAWDNRRGECISSGRSVAHYNICHNHQFI
jgi:hypothetical protein